MLCVHCVPLGQSACVVHMTRELFPVQVAAQAIPV
jgi:hypothetical protein